MKRIVRFIKDGEIKYLARYGTTDRARSAHVFTSAEHARKAANSIASVRGVSDVRLIEP